MNIVLIDKYPILRNGLKLLIIEHFPDSEIIELTDIDSILKLNKTKKVDLIILGTCENHNDSLLEKIISVKYRWPTTKLIIYDDEKINARKIINIFNWGINAYVRKEDNIKILVDSIQFVLTGNNYIGIDKSNLGNFIQELSMQQDIPKSKKRLTSREQLIAKYLCMGKSTSWIAEILERKPSTVSTIKSKIFEKLEVENIISLREKLLDVNERNNKYYILVISDVCTSQKMANNTIFKNGRIQG